jgi:aminoglycoside 3-N-acetyltransferase
MFSRKMLLAQAKELGLNPGDNIMMHASMRAIGTVMGGPDEVHQAIIESISPNGTLCMYVGCEPEFEMIGRRKLSSSQEEFIENNIPPFDPATARARRAYGVLAEFFRSWPGVIYSINPGARVAAFGTKAREFTENHPLNYGYGPDSPFAKIVNNNGKILLLGSDLDQVTILHYAEHVALIEHKRVVRFKALLLENNHKKWIDLEEFDTSIGIRQWPDRFFEAIVKQFIRDNQIANKKFGHADSYLLDAKKLVNFAVKILEQSDNNYPI